MTTSGKVPAHQPLICHFCLAIYTPAARQIGIFQYRCLFIASAKAAVLLVARLPTVPAATDRISCPAIASLAASFLGTSCVSCAACYKDNCISRAHAPGILISDWSFTRVHPTSSR